MVKQFSYINIGLSLSLGWYGTYLPRCENYVRLHHETFKYFNFYAGFTQFQKSISGLKLPILPVLSNWPGIHAPLGASWCDTLFTWAHQCAASCVWIPDPNRFCLKKISENPPRNFKFFHVGFIQFREGVSYQVWVYKTISNYYSEYLAVIDMKHVSSGKEQTLTSAFRAKRRFLSLMMQEKFYFMIHFFH